MQQAAVPTRPPQKKTTASHINVDGESVLETAGH